MTTLNTLENNQSTKMRNAFFQTKSYPWVLITFCSLFLFYKYVLQVSPSVITHELMHRFHLDGASLGNLAATFFYSYLVVQLFAGPLLDRLGARFLTSIAILMCAAGAIWFSQAPTLFQAELARSLIGMGAAFATVSYIKIAAKWFQPKQFAFVSGLLATAAMVGSMCGQLPFALLVVDIGWQSSLLYCGIIGIVYALVFYSVVRDDNPLLSASTADARQDINFRDVMTVIKFKPNWYLMLYSGLAFSTLAVFSGLWGDAFLQAAYTISKPDAATLTSMSFFGLAVGAPILGYLSDRLATRYNVMLYSLLLSLIALVIALYCPDLPKIAEGAALFIFGFATGAFMLVFAVGKELNALAMTATVVAFLNTGEALIGTFSEPFLGKLLDIFGKGAMRNGVSYFSVSDYHIALLALPLYLIGALCFLIAARKSVVRKVIL